MTSPNSDARQAAFRLLPSVDELLRDEAVAQAGANMPHERLVRALGEILDGHRTAVGVIGTHGKGTVSSAITWLLDEAGVLLLDIFTRSRGCALGRVHEFGILNMPGNTIDIYLVTLGEELLLLVKGGDHESPSQKCVV